MVDTITPPTVKITDYPVQIAWSDEDDGYIATCPDLPGCSAFGDSIEQAMAEISDARAAWLEAALKADNPIPLPMPARLDAAEAKLAALQEAVALVIKNTFSYAGDHDWDNLKAALAKSKE